MASPSKNVFASDEADDVFSSAGSHCSDASSLKLGKNFMTCIICEQKCKKTHTKWGACCRKDVEAAVTDAEKQDEEALDAFNEARKTDDGFRLAVLRYKTSCPSRGKGLSRGTMDWAEFAKEMKTISHSGKKDKGEMMELCEWIQWRKHRRGEDSPTATQKWLDFERDSSIERDNDGENGALRLALRLKATWSAGQKRETVETTRSCSKRQKVTDKNREEMLACDHHATMQDIAFLGERAKQFGLTAVASSGSPASAGDKSKGASASSGNKKSTTSRQGSEKIFDLAVEGAEARIAASAMSKTLTKAFDAALVLVAKAKDSYEKKKEFEWAASMAEHYEIAKVRLRLAQAVAESADAVSAFAQTHDGLAPLAGYRNIVSRARFLEMASGLGKDAQSEEQLKAAITQHAQQEALWSAMVEHLGKCAENLSRNIKQGERRSASAAKAEARKKTLEARKQQQAKQQDWEKEQKSIFDVTEHEDAFAQVLSVKQKDLKKNEIAWDKPLLITEVEGLHDHLTSSEVYKTHYSLFQLGWPKDTLYSKKGKATYDITEIDTLLKPKPISTILKELLPSFSLSGGNAMADKELNDKLEAFLRSLSLFAFAGKKVVPVTEPRGFATLRYQSSGKRLAILAPKKAMAEAMFGKEAVDQSKLSEELQSANDDKVTLLKEAEVQLWKVEVPANSILYTPAGFASSTKADLDVFGCVLSVTPGLTGDAGKDTSYKAHVASTFSYLFTTMADPATAQAKVWHHISGIFG